MAILLLQYYPIASHLGVKRAHPQCNGNHRQCGCAPERIASRTCCCFNHKPACCDKDQHHDEESIANKEKKPSSRYFSTAPCGGSPKFITASLDKIKFMRQELPKLVPVVLSVCFTASEQETFRNRFGEPPDHPPKLVLFS